MTIKYDEYQDLYLFVGEAGATYTLKELRDEILKEHYETEYGIYRLKIEQEDDTTIGDTDELMNNFDRKGRVLYLRLYNGEGDDLPVAELVYQYEDKYDRKITGSKGITLDETMNKLRKSILDVLRSYKNL